MKTESRRGFSGEGGKIWRVNHALNAWKIRRETKPWRFIRCVCIPPSDTRVPINQVHRFNSQCTAYSLLRGRVNTSRRRKTCPRGRFSSISILNTPRISTFLPDRQKKKRKKKKNTSFYTDDIFRFRLVIRATFLQRRPSFNFLQTSKCLAVTKARDQRFRSNVFFLIISGCNISLFPLISIMASFLSQKDEKVAGSRSPLQQNISKLK